MKNNYSKLTFDILIFGIGIALAKMVQFLLMPLYTSYLSTNEYGNAELINNISELLLPIVTLCIYEAALRFSIENKQDTCKIISVSITVLLYMNILFLVLIILLNLLFNNKLIFYLYLVTISYALKTLLAYYIRGKGRRFIFSISGCVNAIALVMYNYIFLVVMKYKVEGYLFSIFLAYTTTSIYIFVFGEIYKEIVFDLHIIEDAKALLAYSLPLIIYNIFYWITNISGRYILLFFKDSNTAGLYVATLKIAAFINLFQQIVYAAFQLNASQEFYSKKREQYYSRVINIFCKIFLILGMLMVSITPFLADFTLKKEFNAGKIYLPLIMLAAVINCSSSLFGVMYTAYKVTNRTMIVSIIGAIINVAVAIVLVPHIGIFGVCIASILCYLGQVVYRFFDLKKFCILTIDVRTILIMFVIFIFQVGYMTFLLM